MTNLYTFVSINWKMFSFKNIALKVCFIHL